MVVDLNSRSILDKNDEVVFNTWDEIAQGEGEASLNMLTPNSSPNSGSVISFMYTRTLLRPYSSAFSVWPTDLHNHSKNHSVAMGGTICYDEQLISI